MAARQFSYDFMATTFNFFGIWRLSLPNSSFIYLSNSILSAFIFGISGTLILEDQIFNFEQLFYQFLIILYQHFFESFVFHVEKSFCDWVFNWKILWHEINILNLNYIFSKQLFCFCMSLRSSEIILFWNLQLFYWHFLEILWIFIFLVFYFSFKFLNFLSLFYPRQHYYQEIFTG